MSQITRKERQQELSHVALETVLICKNARLHLPPPEVKCLLISSCQALETFYIRSVYKQHQNFDSLNGIAFIDFKPYGPGPFNTTKDYRH